jgi:hypothetical protein
MSYTHLAIQDAGMLLDLLQAQLFRPAFQLPYTYCITDVAFYSLDEAMQQELAPYVASGKVCLMPCTDADHIVIGNLMRQHPRLSRAECSVYHLASVNQWPMLASCPCLYGWVYVPPITVFNMSWLVNELLIQAKITKKVALVGVERIAKTNFRLRVECAALRKAIMAS